MILQEIIWKQKKITCVLEAGQRTPTLKKSRIERFRDLISLIYEVLFWAKVFAEFRDKHILAYYIGIVI